MTVLLLISASLALFFAGLIFLKKNKNYSDYLLGFWFVFTAFHMGMLYFQMYNAKNNYPIPEIIGTDISFVAVHPIWIFIYILSFVQPQSNNFRLLWHLIPILILNLVLLNTFYLKSSAEKIRSYEISIGGEGYIDKGLELTVLLVISISLAYLIASYWLLRKHLRNVKNHYSTLEGVDLKWLRVLLYCIAIAFILNAVMDLSRNYFDSINSLASIYFGYIIILVAITYIGIHGIKQTKIFVSYDSIGKEENRENDRLKGSQNQDEIELVKSLDADFKKIVQLVESEKPYCDFDLNLDKLAEISGFKARYLSQIINQSTGKNFFDFINSFRIKEFKKRIKQPENKNYTLISVAYDCGFNSKATFNRVFKNQTGYTPSQFMSDSSLD